MKLIQHVWMACIGLCLFSCTQTDELETAQGKTGFIVSLTDGTKLDVSRATPGDIVDSEGIEGADFNLRIVNVETKEEIYNKKVGTGVIDAYSGVYDLTATYGENPVLALDAPYFKGETTGVEVFNDQTTPVTIACKVANALVSVKYDNSKASFDDVYSNYYVEVKVGSATPVQIDKTGAKSAYMQAGSAFDVIFHGTIDGTDKAVTLGSEFEVPTTLNAGDHLKLTLSPKLDRFEIPLNIESVAVETATLTEEIPMKWLPKPKVEAEGFTDNELSFVETEQKNAKLKLTLSSALQDIKFKFDFEDEQFASLGEEKEYLWSDEENRKVISEQLGIAVSDNSIDLNGLLAKLQTNAGATTTNIIEVDVKANDRWSSENKTANLTYTLTCNKPVFTVDAYPGNIWTKEFTVNTLREEQVASGDFTTLSRNMTYQYSIDGQTNWMTLSDGMRQDQLQPGITYYIRGLYRGAVPSEVAEVKTYEAMDIPNSTFDDGYDITYPKDDNPLYIFKGDWIDTRNELTCHSDGINAFYVSKSSTLPINDNGSTVAHMMVIGWGAGNTCSFGEKDNWIGNSVINHISAGIACVGDYDVSSDVINAKEAYIRPSSLTFTYKASPYNGDEYLIEATLLNITDGIETIIGEGKLQSGALVDSYTTQSLDITYDESAKELPVSHVKVLFKAGTKEDRDHLEDKFRDAGLGDGYSNAYIIGSQFWLDSFHFNYNK